MGLLARTFVGALLAGSGLVTACGHSAFDELPSSDEGLTNDGGTVADARVNEAEPPVNDEGGTLPDGGHPLIDAAVTDGGDFADATTGDAGCTGCDVFVSAQAGNDGNPGTVTAPVQTITKGIALAVALALPRTDVRIADGTYNEDVTVSEGVSLHGGYACAHLPCSWTAPSQPTGTSSTKVVSHHSIGMQVPATVTRATVIEDLSISSLAGVIDPTGTFGSAAMTITGAPTVQHCSLGALPSNGGVDGAQRSVGLVIAGPGAGNVGALVTDCTITAAAGAMQSVGVLFSTGSTAVGAVADAVIQNSTITSGSAPQSIGVLASQTSTAQLLHNSITSGSTTNSTIGRSWGVEANAPLVIDGNQINTSGANIACTSTSAFCGGIMTSTASARIVNNWVRGVSNAPKSAAILINTQQSLNPTLVIVDSNTLDGGGTNGANGSSSISAAIVLSNAIPAGGTPAIARVANNILAGGSNAFRYGVYENPLAATARCAVLDTNDFFLRTPAGPSDVLYHVWDPITSHPTDILTLDDLKTMIPSPTPTPNGNIGVDPVLNGYRISPNSKCVNAGSVSVYSPLADIVGTKRGPAPDIGAFEAVP